MSQATVSGAAEIQDALAAFRDGRLTEDEIRPTRLRWGVYAQRQPDAYVIRLRGTGGAFSAKQVEAVAGDGFDVRVNRLADPARTGASMLPGSTKFCDEE